MHKGYGTLASGDDRNSRHRSAAASPIISSAATHGRPRSVTALAGNAIHAILERQLRCMALVPETATRSRCPARLRKLPVCGSPHAQKRLICTVLLLETYRIGRDPDSGHADLGRSAVAVTARIARHAAQPPRASISPKTRACLCGRCDRSCGRSARDGAAACNAMAGCALAVCKYRPQRRIDLGLLATRHHPLPARHRALQRQLAGHVTAAD
jgi:hypothetical protein